MPRALQIFLRRRLVRYKLRRHAETWPIDEGADQTPPNWPGWPNGKKFALVLMHDVDTQKGHDNCHNLMDLEEQLGVRSIFNFVPERYQISKQLLKKIQGRGFEIGVHGLKHDGKLFLSHSLFLKRAKQINQYLADWNSRGFSSPSMHHNLQWMHALNIDYSTSTFDTDPFEPQPEGVATIFPFWVNGAQTGQRYLELPYTMPQDFTLFIIMQQNNIDLWMRKLRWIADKGGMALLNTHPDYMNFSNGKNRREEYRVDLYANLIKNIQTQYKDQFWQPLPSQVVSHFNAQQSQQIQLTQFSSSIPQTASPLGPVR
jgi:peptidoglycan/xylan/chitin deacetylase (PgdA/CDA1 family)